MLTQTLGLAATGDAPADDTSSSGGVMDWISSNVHWIAAGVIAWQIARSIEHATPLVKEVRSARVAMKK